MKKKIIYGLLLAVAMVTASSSFVSCKDYEGDDYAHWQDKLAENEINGQNTLRDLLYYQIRQLRYELTNATGNTWSGDPYTQAQLDAWLSQLDAIEQGLKDGTISPLEALSMLNKLIEECAFVVDHSLQHLRYAWSDSLAKAYQTAFAAYYTANHDSIRIDSLAHRADSLFGVANHLADSALYIADSIGKALLDSINDLTARVDRDSARIDDLTGRVDDLTGRVDRDSARIDDLTERVKLDSVRIDLLALKVDEVIEAYQKADSILAQQIADLNNKVDSLYDEITGRLDQLKKALQTEITGIEIQATYNPIFGEFAVPAGIQSNVLATWYGKYSGPVVFPIGDDAANKALWVGGDVKVSDSELPTPKNGVQTYADGIVIDTLPGNAGTLYLTVNPSNVDFSGTTFTLRKSNDSLSLVKLEQLEPSAVELKWGYTRGNNLNNGFYAAKATISKDDVENIALTYDFNKTEIKDALKDVLHNWRNPSKINKSELADIVLRNLQQSVPRLGVQATWQDTLNGGLKHYVSKYDLAAVSAKPLGFDFLYDADYSWMVEKVRNRFNNRVHYYENDLKSLLIFDLGLPVNNDQIDIKITADNKVYVFPKDDHTLPKDYDALGNPTEWFKSTDAIAVVDLDTFLTQINSSIANSITGLNTTMTAIDGLQGRIDSKLGQISSMISSYAKHFLTWTDRFFNKAAAVLAHPNRFVQPALFATADGEQVVYLSTVKEAPTHVKAGAQIALFPTTLTGELVAPAFKKYIAVVNVADASDNEDAAAITTLNAFEGMNEVVDGAKYNQVKPLYITVDDSMKGKTIEIIYEALGYSGVNGLVAGKKYFITVE